MPATAFVTRRRLLSFFLPMSTLLTSSSLSLRHELREHIWVTTTQIRTANHGAWRCCSLIAAHSGSDTNAAKNSSHE
jgi:hypothetical protein